MTIEVAIAGVDGTTNLQLETDSPGVALNFLRAYDHEGAGVSITIEGSNEEAYRLLEAAEIIPPTAATAGDCTWRLRIEDSRA